MIKIIKMGNPKARLGKCIYHHTCKICKCEYEYNIEDTIEERYGKVVKCPCCGINNNLELREDFIRVEVEKYV